MDKLLKEILKLVLEIKEISESNNSISGINNELLGFLCNQSSLLPQQSQEYFISVSMKMSEIFDKYNISPDEFGIS